VTGTDEATEVVPEAKPVLRVVKGEPSAEELAALVAVVAARSVAAPAAKPAPRSQWGHPARMVRTPHAFGPGQWRASALPR
jgi:hypothetical protein